MLSGIDLNTAINVNEGLQRAARMISLKVSVPDTSKRVPYTLYDGVFDYPGQPDMFGGAFVDFRPQGASRNYSDYVYRKQIEDFDRTKTYNYNGVSVTFEYVNGVQILRAVSSRVTPRATIDTMAQIGNWKVFVSASSLIVDNTVYYQQPGSLLFNLAANQTSGGIQETLTSPLNLSAYQSTGVIFVAVYLPSTAAVSAITGITVNIGTNSANYYSITNNVTTLGPLQPNTWMLIPLALSTATLGAGTATLLSILTALSFVQINFTYSSTVAIQNIRAGMLFAALPFPYELLYQSAAIFLPNAGPNSGVPQQTITNDNDAIILSDDIYLIYQYESAIAVAADNGANLSNPVVAQYMTELNGTRTRTGLVVTYGLYDLYRSKHPSEEVPTVGTYY